MAIQRLIALAIAPGLVACLGCADPGASVEGADGTAEGVRRVDGGSETSDATAGAVGSDGGQPGTASSDAGSGSGDAGRGGIGTSGDAGTTAGNSDGGTGTATRDGGSDAATGRGDAGGSTPPAAATAEDEGADCPTATLPEAAALPAIAKLPDPFKKLDGTRISTKAEWRCRRAEIKRLAEKFAYGTKLARPASVTGTVSNTSISVNVTDNGKSATFSAAVSLPASGTGPYPAVVILGGFGADSATIKGEGVATINYDPFAVGKETGARSPKSGAYYSIAGSTSSTGLLVAWAWGVSRILDVIEKSDGKILKADAVGVTGCSRFGKGAFAIGVFDQRIALTMPIESGSAGVPLWRGIPGEGAQSLSSAYGEQPWLGDAFGSFTSKPTSLPIDTHELVAMVAPRGLFIMDNPHIANLGPRSAHVAALAGAEVYAALGARDNITYHSDVQNGSHCAVRPEWTALLKQNIQKFLKKAGSEPGVIKAASKAAGKLSDWTDWSAPMLN
ncbi:MAG TPA: PE PGRS family protein [Polyangiaceae bacterium]|nr:PE PGRS family protein [Polyangiaceae bacterium]